MEFKEITGVVSIFRQKVKSEVTADTCHAHDYERFQTCSTEEFDSVAAFATWAYKQKLLQTNDVVQARYRKTSADLYTSTYLCVIPVKSDSADINVNLKRVNTTFEYEQ